MSIIGVSRHMSINGSLAESVANTVNYEKVEIPGSQGAKSVILEDIAIDVNAPNAVNSTETIRSGAILVGNQENETISAPLLSNRGNVCQVGEALYTDGSGVQVTHTAHGPVYREGPFPVPKYTDDKYYVTPIIKSSNCTTVGTVYYRLDFTIEF